MKINLSNRRNAKVVIGACGQEQNSIVPGRHASDEACTRLFDWTNSWGAAVVGHLGPFTLIRSTCLKASPLSDDVPPFDRDPSGIR